MTTIQYPAGEAKQKITIGAGSAFKFGFFAALGALLVGMIISTILAIIAVALGGLTYLAALNGLGG